MAKKIPLYVRQAMSNPEHAFWLETLFVDTDVTPETVTVEECVAEARYVVDLMREVGTRNWERLHGEDGPDEQRAARSELRKAEAYVQRWGGR